MDDVGDNRFFALGHTLRFRHFFGKVTAQVVSGTVQIDITIEMFCSQQGIHDETYRT